jgi:hypothetical protein
MNINGHWSGMIKVKYIRPNLQEDVNLFAHKTCEELSALGKNKKTNFLSIYTVNE